MTAGMPSSALAMMFATLERVRKLTVRSGRARVSARHTDQMLRRSECWQSSCCTSIQRGTSYIAASRSSSRSEIWLFPSSPCEARNSVHMTRSAPPPARELMMKSTRLRPGWATAPALASVGTARADVEKSPGKMADLRNCRRAPDIRELTCTSARFNHGSRDNTRHPRSMFSKCHQRPRSLRATGAQPRPARMVPHPGSLRYMMAA